MSIFPYPSLLLLPMLLIATGCRTADEKAASALAARIVPAYASRISFRQTRDSADCYTLETRRSGLVISGNNANSMAAGLHRYLTQWCGVDVSWYAADPVVCPEEMPAVGSPVTCRAAVPRRFFLNYCTFGYSLPWWHWEDWERLIDWMALNGVNLPLAITGQEAVWQEVWRRHGLTDEQIRAYFTGPAHLPWHRMCNIDGVDGPLPQGWIDAQATLQKKILKRERELGMHPVLPAFAGHVPAQLREQYPGARITDISGWGGFQEPNLPHFLSPADPLFAIIQEQFLTEQQRLFGTDHIYGFDLFNEVDAPSWEPDTLADIGRSAYQSVAAVDPGAEWIQMGWLFHYDRRHWTPENVKAYLQAVPQGKVTLLDYYTEHTPVWSRTESFYGQPYIFCYLGNFGGNTRLAGPFGTMSRRISEVLEKGGDNLSGIGGTLEGLDLNRWFHEYVLSHAWETGTGDEAWLSQLDRRRHSPDGFWKSMADSIYRRGSFSEGALLCGRPCPEGRQHWTVEYRTPYDNATLVRRWRELLDAPQDHPAWRADVVTIGTQALGNHFATLRDAFTQAWKAGDRPGAESLAAELRALMTDIARLAACEPSFRLDRWLDGAAGWADTPEEEAYYRHNAWHLITTWGDAPNLNDYASRLWSGLVTHYYAPRWELFLEEAFRCMDSGESFDQKAFESRMEAFEKETVERAPAVRDLPAGDAESLAREALERYFGR